MLGSVLCVGVMVLVIGMAYFFAFEFKNYVKFHKKRRGKVLQGVEEA